MKILVCGGRDYDEWPKMKEYLDSLHEKCTVTEVIHGGADGADRLAGVWARWNCIKETVYKADWKKYKKAAGPIRNLEMLDTSKPDLVLVFPGGKGTAHMRKIAEDGGYSIRMPLGSTEKPAGEFK